MSKIVRRRPIPTHVDAALALALTVGAVLEIWLAGNAGNGRGAATLMAFGTIAPIAVRRRWPTLVGAGVPALAALDHQFFSPQFVGYPIANFCAMYALAVWTPPRRFALGLVVFAITNLAVGRDISRIGLLWVLASVAAMLLVRTVVVGRERRAELAERERGLVAREAVLEERARIARELHDSVAHYLSIIVVQAGAERRALDGAGDGARETLESIEQVGRGSLTELRRLLGTLRREQADASVAEAAARE